MNDLPQKDAAGKNAMKDTMADHDLRAGAKAEKAPEAKPPGPCAIVIFGAGGDLTKRLLVPALYNLANTGLIPENFALIGADIGERSKEDWTGSLLAMLKSFTKDPSAEDQLKSVDEKSWAKLADRMSYVQGDFTKPEFYKTLGDHLAEVEKTHQTGGNRLFYFAVAGRFFGTIVENLGKAELAKEEEDGKGPWRRVVIEKPFGNDVASAKALNAQVLSVLRETQVYRIDHFLGKETVQSIMAMRFANGIFEPVWNRDRIEHVQITVAETVGVEGRGKFYEQAGALRDMVPNHVFQLVAMTAMEPPVGFNPESIRNKKQDLYASIEAVTPEDVVRGQYGPGTKEGKPAVGYREEPDVAKDSATETYVALRLMIDNWRWAGVPFYIRTGKNLPARLTEIAIQFKKVPLAPFQNTPLASLEPNWLVLRIQPDEGIAFEFEVKRPGQVMRVAPVKMNFNYADWFTPEPNVGYETLIYDCMIGDQTLFQRADMVEESWRVVQPALDAWKANAPKDFPNYATGSSGPDAADALMTRDDPARRWRPIQLPKKAKSS